MPAVLNEEGIVLIGKASEILQKNQISVSKAQEVGKQIKAFIESNGMSDAIDEKCNIYLVKVNETVKNMNDRRSPITQLFTAVAKQFTSLENEMKEGETVKFIQKCRNEWAAQKAAAKKAAEEEAKRKLAIENEKVEVRKKVHSDLIMFVSGQINTVTNSLLKAFNDATLDNIDAVSKKIKGFSCDYKPEHYDLFKCEIVSLYLNKDEINSIVEEVKNEKWKEFSQQYWEAVDETQINIEAKLPARKNELERIAILEKENADAAEKAKKEAAERQKAEVEKARIETAEKAKAAELKAQAQADADKMNNLFAATEAAIIPGEGKAQVRTSLKIVVTHQSAWVEIFTHFMQIEGMKLGIDELGKKSLNQMKASCEKHATKTGELITSKYIKYEEDFTAVNKA